MAEFVYNKNYQANIDFSNAIWDYCDRRIRIYNDTLKLRFGICIDMAWVQLNSSEIRSRNILSISKSFEVLVGKNRTSKTSRVTH